MRSNIFNYVLSSIFFIPICRLFQIIEFLILADSFNSVYHYINRSLFKFHILFLTTQSNSVLHKTWIELKVSCPKLNIFNKFEIVSVSNNRWE